MFSRNRDVIDPPFEVIYQIDFSKAEKDDTAVGSTVLLLLGSNIFDQVHHSVTIAILIVIPVKHNEK